MSDFTPIPTDTSETRDRLSFGVEFEIVIAALKEDTADPTPDDPRPAYGLIQEQLDSDSEEEDRASQYGQQLADPDEFIYDHVAKTLSAAGHQADWIPERDPPRGQRRKVIDKRSWEVKEDCSISSPVFSNADPEFDEQVRLTTPYVFLSAEVVSPPFYYDTKSLDAIERVCEVLSDKYRISCNQSCGLHVHVGNAMKGFDLDMVSKLFGIVFTFELQIDSMHPSHRIRNRQHCLGLRYESKLMKGLVQPEHGKSLLRCALEWILGGARNMDQLVRGMHKPPPRIGGGLEGRMAYNMWNLLVGTGNKKTIEFRQHESTLDPERVVNWIRFCVGLVEYAESINMRDLKPFLFEHIDHELADFDIAEVIEALGMPPDLGEYYLKVSDAMVGDHHRAMEEDRRNREE